jgi:hypothetical protein
MQQTCMQLKLRTDFLRGVISMIICTYIHFCMQTETYEALLASSQIRPKTEMLA